MAVRKQRLDKYYTLAKEKGYRARSAFKLLELNRKFNFLSNAHIAVDLCAAPGGWMQILAQEMPSPRKIIGIDLDPIKPLGSDVISFVSDITTVDCRRTLIRYLEGHQVDIFVHDGAPNFGTSKERDIFVQNDLVLHALKLATEFLKEGGLFVTKIFRSENFCKITKVLGELFTHVDVTKPLSSRSESAEIFAVCRGFKNPEVIDPAYFNSEVLFCDEAIDKEDNKKLLLSDFIRNTSNKALRESAKIIIDFECSLITPEYVEMFNDLKLLNGADLKKIGKLKAKIIKEMKEGTLTIPLLEDMFEEESEEAAPEKPQTVDEKLDEMKKILEKQKKRVKTSTPLAVSDGSFFADRIFEDFESSNGAEVEEVEKRPAVEIQVDSCSDSMEFTESELQCAVMMKKMGDKFADTTIDRNAVDSDDLVLPCEKRPCKLDEFNAIPKTPKKVRESLGRKRARALRRTERAMSEIEVEDEREEAIVYKKVFKNMYKKQRSKLRVLFPKGKGKIAAPKGKGRVKCLDARMKHDLRMSKRRSLKRR